MEGYINSIETIGLVDGPGIRFVVFMQGCNLRCSFCHNPETWAKNKGEKIKSEELLKKILKYKNYYGKIGGVTFSGGEPLVQSDFLIDILKKCKENKINTCIDTAGVGGDNIEEILKYTDLVIMDIKALTPECYKKITGYDINESICFLNKCKELKKRIWIRQVIIPTINDNAKYIKNLKKYLGDYNYEKIEFLPYSTIGVSKYLKLNIPYKLKDIPKMDLKKINYLYELYKKI